MLLQLNLVWFDQLLMVTTVFKLYDVDAAFECTLDDALFLLQVLCQSVLGLDIATANTLPPPFQLLLQQERDLPQPAAAVSAGGNSCLVCLHRNFLLHWRSDWLMFWNWQHGCSQKGVHIQSHLQARRVPLVRLWHLRTFFHPVLLRSFHHGGNGSYGFPEDSQSLCTAQNGSQLTVCGSESHHHHLGVDVCLHLCLLPWPLSQVARDCMRPAGLVPDISGLVSKAFVTRTPPSAPSKRTETTRLSCSHTFLYNIVAAIAAILKTTHYSHLSLGPSWPRYLKSFPPHRKVILYKRIGLKSLHSVGSCAPKMTLGNQKQKQDAARVSSFSLSPSVSVARMLHHCLSASLLP